MKGAKIIKTAKQFYKSVWFFPFILMIVVLSLSIFEISGSSIGQYNKYFYHEKPDQNLILNKPRAIRSDEWIVVTQLTIAQKHAGFPRINPNLGNGQDMSVVVDVPYKEWSTIFKPHNLPFYFLPLEIAFALKWWILSFLLVLSTYLFILEILPNRRLFAIFISVAFLFSPFIQWWYQYITVGPIYYSLFIAVVVIRLLNSTKRRAKILYSIVLTYLFVSFALVQYPAFQISCAVALGLFLIGYFISKSSKLSRDRILGFLGYIGSSIIVSLAIVGVFIYTRIDTVKTINNTVYPGRRIVESGGFDIQHTLSGHLAYEFQFTSKAEKYKVSNDATNQSEASNFILIIPFLIPVGTILLFDNKIRKSKAGYGLAGTTLAIALCLVWMFIPGLDIVGKLLLFEKIPLNRMLIGLGMLNIIYLVLFIQIYQKYKGKILDHKYIIAYSLAVFMFELMLGMRAYYSFPGFISKASLLLLSFPIPLTLYFLLIKKYNVAAFILLIFSFVSSGAVHPLYKSLNIVDTPLSVRIRQTVEQDPGAVWATEDALLQNFALINGARSMNGVYTYPQIELWDDIASVEESIYNRYAHTNFVFDRNLDQTIKTTLLQPGADRFGIVTEPCSEFMKANKVEYILTPVKFNPSESCLKIKETVSYPEQEFFIYEVQ